MNLKVKRLRARYWYVLGISYQFYGVRTGLKRAFETSEAAYCRALDLDPRFVTAQFRRGVLYWRELHRYAPAIADFTEVLAQTDQFPEAVFMRGMAHQALSHYADSAQDLRTFLAGNPTSRWYENAARQLRLIEAILEELPPLLGNGETQLLP